jgi:hypothetical protein
VDCWIACCLMGDGCDCPVFGAVSRSPLPTRSGYMLDVSLLRHSIALLNFFDLWNLAVCT